MALLSPKLHRFLLTKLHHSSSSSSSSFSKTTKTNKLIIRRRSSRCCSAIAIDAPSSLTDNEGIRWGSATLQGLREEMEDAAVVRSDGIDGYLFAAVFDGHGGYSSVKFLRDELYKDCVAALQGGLLMKRGDFNLIKAALEKAFDDTDKRLLLLLETVAGEDESGSTATVALIGNDVLFISHIGDSCVVLSRSGGSQVLTSSHRPYGNNSTSLQEVRRIREAGGWIVNGRICGDISVSRAFGDIRFKTKKNEMLQKGVEEKRWSEKFVSRVRFNGDLVTASPDILQVALGSNVEFVLIASDGLWDYMSSSDAVTFVRNQLRQHGDVQLASEALAQAALEKGSQDNISIVVADLGRTDWQNLPLQKDNFIFELAQAFATIGIVTFGVWISSVFSL